MMNNILQQVTSDFTASKEQRVKSYASYVYKEKIQILIRALNET